MLDLPLWPLHGNMGAAWCDAECVNGVGSFLPSCTWPAVSFEMLWVELLEVVLDWDISFLSITVRLKFRFWLFLGLIFLACPYILGASLLCFYMKPYSIHTYGFLGHLFLSCSLHPSLLEPFSWWNFSLAMEVFLINEIEACCKLVMPSLYNEHPSSIWSAKWLLKVETRSEITVHWHPQHDSVNILERFVS